MRHTKIICTIGPSVNSVEKIVELIKAGMSVARINFSHGTHEEHLKTIKMLKDARKKCSIPLAIMLDTKGPEIRVGKLSDEGIPVTQKERIYLVEKPQKRRKEVVIKPYIALKNVKKGMPILFDNGYIISKVVEKKDDYILVEIQNDGVIKSQKGVNVPDADLFLPAMVESDILDLKFGCQHGIDLVAASFIRSAAHVLEIKKLLSEESGRDIPLVAKIENKEGVANFDDILEAADGIMVARGDLGVEINLGLVPKLQKQMISKSSLAFKPVITATQMLESMITNPRPTRAEVSDVANAIYDGTSAVMLSGETAVGKYPIEVVRQMENIVIHTEDDLDYMSFFEKSSKNRYNDVSTCVAIAAVKTAYNANAKAIFVYTSSGFTARLMSSLRPRQPIVALTSDEKTYHQLAFLWGVVPILSKCKDENEAFHIMSQYAQEKKMVEFGDIVVTTTGIPFGRRGATNMMVLSTIGHILVKGTVGFGKIIKGKISIVRSPRAKIKAARKIIIIPRCDATYLPLLEKVSCIVLQNHAGDLLSEKYAMNIAKKFNISYVGRADNAMSILNEGDEVVVNPLKGLIYK